MEKKHARRLLKLADFLMTVPRERFDLNTWVGDNWGGKPDLSCGTTACAVGWAATMPGFRRLGLRIQKNVHCPGSSRPCLVDKNGDRVVADEYHAIREIFGEDADYEDLFMPNGGQHCGLDRATPKQMAKRIREFVKAHA